MLSHVISRPGRLVASLGLAVMAGASFTGPAAFAAPAHASAATATPAPNHLEVYAHPISVTTKSGHKVKLSVSGDVSDPGSSNQCDALNVVSLVITGATGNGHESDEYTFVIPCNSFTTGAHSAHIHPPRSATQPITQLNLTYDNSRSGAVKCGQETDSGKLVGSLMFRTAWGKYVNTHISFPTAALMQYYDTTTYQPGCYRNVTPPCPKRPSFTFSYENFGQTELGILGNSRVKTAFASRSLGLSKPAQASVYQEFSFRLKGVTVKEVSKKGPRYTLGVTSAGGLATGGVIFDTGTKQTTTRTTCKAGKGTMAKDAFTNWSQASMKNAKHALKIHPMVGHDFGFARGKDVAIDVSRDSKV